MTAPNPLSPELEAMVLRVAIDIANRVSPSEDGDERDPDNMMVLRVAQEEIKRALSPHLQEMLEAERERCAQAIDLFVNNTGEMLLQCGEMTADEIRLVKAVLKQRAQAIRSNP